MVSLNIYFLNIPKLKLNTQRLFSHGPVMLHPLSNAKCLFKLHWPHHDYLHGSHDSVQQGNQKA